MPTGNTQQVINYGASANDGQGDPLRTAFIKTDDNFDNIWLAGPVGSNVQITNNTIGVLNTNGNLILSPNGVGVIQTNNTVVPRSNKTYDLGSANLQYRTVYANAASFLSLGLAGDLTVGGNLTVQGNIIQVGNIVTETLTIQLANAATTANAANGSGITVGASDNIATLLYNSTSNVWTTNIGLSATGNITAPYFVGNGSQLTGLAIPYGNSNVATFLASYGSNTITTTGNVTAGNVLTSAEVIASGVVQSGTGLSTGGYLSVDGSTSLHDTTVTGNLSADTLTTPELTVNVIRSDDSTIVVIEDGVEVNGDAVVNGNISGEFILGNISLATGFPATYGNANVADYLPTYTGNLNSVSAIPGSAVTGSVSLANIANVAYSVAGANVSGQVANAAYANISGVAYSVAGANVSGQVANAAYANISGVSYSVAVANVSGIGNIATINLDGNVANILRGDGSFAPEGGNLTANYANFAGEAFSVSGANVSGQVANALIAGTVYTNAQPNITSIGNLSSLTVTGNITGSANISGTYILGNGAFLTGLPANYGNANVANYLPTFSGNISAGNVSATGNISGAYVKGNGSELTNLPAPAVTQDITSNGAMSIMTYDGVIKYVNYATVEPSSGNIAGGNISTTGNISGNYVLGNGSQLTGLPAQYGNANVVAYGEAGWSGNIIPSANATYSLGNSTMWWSNAWFASNTIYIGGVPLGVSSNELTFNGNAVVTANATGTTTTTGNVSITGNVSANNIIANNVGNIAALNLTGNASTVLYGNGVFAAAAASSSYGNANVATFLSAYGNNTISTTGNITAGNLIGNISITGTVYTAAQPNITSIGTLTSLTVSGNSDFGAVANVKISGGSNGYVLKTDGSGNLSWVSASTATGNANVGGSNTQVQFNNGTNLAGSANLTFDTTTNTLSATNFVGNGSGLTGIVASSGTATKTANGTSNVDITTANGNITMGVGGTAGVVTITTTGINVVGYINAGSGVITGNGSGLTSIAGANVTGNVGNALNAYAVAGANVSGAVSFATTANSVAGANVSGAVGLATFAGTANSVAGANVSGAVGLATFAGTANSVAGANVSGQVGNALVAGTVYTAAQPNITSTGTLTSLTVTGNVSANYFIGNGSQLTGSILATPAWTSAGAITLTATTTSPTKGTTTSDNISYRQLGAKQWEVVLTYIQTVSNGVNGSGDYLITLPNGLSFDTTLPSQPLYTGGVGTNTYDLMTYIIPSGSGLITNGALGGQVYPIVYNATKFRILTTSWGTAIQCIGSSYYGLADDPRIQLTFRFTST